MLGCQETQDTAWAVQSKVPGHIRGRRLKHVGYFKLLELAVNKPKPGAELSYLISLRVIIGELAVPMKDSNYSPLFSTS